MQVDPCKVCGNTEVNLVDGYYYCVECGTQDVNARQTIVEHTALADGTFGIASSKKFSVAIRKDGIQMSGEWYKWHAYNFILAGLADEMIALGAKPSFKSKLLWVWTRYIKKYQNKNEMANSSQLEDHRDNSKLTQFEAEEDKSDSNNESDIEEQEEQIVKSKQIRRDIKHVTKGLLLAMLYVALNLDESDIQMFHLFRFIKEGHLNIHRCTKYIPKEINVKCIPHWHTFAVSNQPYNPFFIGILAMQLFRVLDLGKPVIPDLKKILDNYLKELCLPNDFKEFVLSLMQYAPYNFSLIVRTCGVDAMFFPNYEGIVMSYILVALKICFGLDDDYEIRLSNAVDTINNKNDYPRSHKFGRVSEPTDRLFSFRKWCNYMQFRKKIICKYNLALAETNNLDVDDYVFMEHSNERSPILFKRNLVDDIAMDMLKKIPHNIETGVIKKNQFPRTLTPFSTYTEFILQYIQDSDLRILLSEDFSQYSIKYACKDLNLQVDNKNLVTGIDDSNKTIVNGEVGSDLAGKKYDSSLVYVKHCQNKNWLKTKPPTERHIIKEYEEKNDEESDHGYNSKREDTPDSESADQDNEEDKKKVEMIDEEQEGVNIFDDTFEDVDEKEDKMFRDEYSNTEVNNDFEQIEDKYDTKQDEEIVQDCSLSQQNEHKSLDRTEDNFDPNLFDRDNAIKSLILDACEKYKIPIPNEYSQKRPLKRKPNLANNETGETNAKRRKRPGEEKKKVDKLLSAYYNNLEQEVLSKLAEEMKLVFKNLINQPELNEPDKSLAESSSVLNDSNQPCDQSDMNINNLSHDQANQMTNQDIILNEENRSVQQEPDSSAIVNNIENEEKGTEDSVCKEDPKFDEKTYDIRQLYLKLQDEINVEEIINLENSEVDRIIDKQLQKYCGKRVIADLENTTSDSDENMPLAVLQRRKMKAKREKKILLKSRLHKLKPLIKGTYSAPTFNYWIRQYCNRIYRSDDLFRRCELELERNCPKSFTFVIHECATIIGCSSYSLWKLMQQLERSLLYRLGCMSLNPGSIRNLKF